MRGVLVRVGVDQAFGGWNAPVDPDTREFVYVPIPDNVEFQPGLATPYEMTQAALREFRDSRDCARPERLELPDALSRANMHLDPDFGRLTYGDDGNRRGKGIAALERGDTVVFYAGLRPCRPCSHRLIYAIIGLFRVNEVVRVRDVEREAWGDNAHTRRLAHRGDDVIVRGVPKESGRLRRCLPIGEWRDKAYRVRRELLDEWGDLSCKNGFIQRSAVPPRLLDPVRFLAWFESQSPELIAANNPTDASAKSSRDAPVIVVMLRRPGKQDFRTDPLFEFGSFGLTGCHRANLLSDCAAAGCRLAFAQGGPEGFRLVFLTPPIDVRELGDRHEASWSPAEMPLRYTDAPLLIDNLGHSDIPGLHEHIDDVRRESWVARFSSAFRSRKTPLPADIGSAIAEVWQRAVETGGTRATAYWESLPRKPLRVDTDREATYRRLQRAAIGEPSPGRCR